jgi:DNA polymerase-4
MAEMGDRPVIDLWGIGSRTATKLHAHDIHTVRDLALVDHRLMAGWFGPTIGPGLKLLGMGGASTRVVTEPAAVKSRSKQVTYPRDLTDPGEIAVQVASLADDVSAEVFGHGRTGTHVGVTVRTSTFFTRVKTAKLAAPSTDAAVIRAAALHVLGKFELDRPVRLLGVRIDLADPDPVDPNGADP